MRKYLSETNWRKAKYLMTASLSDDMENREPYRHLLAGVKVGLSTLNSKGLVCEPKEAQQQAPHWPSPPKES